MFHSLLFFYNFLVTPIFVSLYLNCLLVWLLLRWALMIGAQDFDYSVIQCGFLCICPPWGLLIFIDLWAYRSVKFGKNNFFIFFPLPLLLIFRDSSCMYVRLPSLSHKSMFCPLLKVFSSLFCILYNFAIYSSLGSYISLLLQGLIHHYSHLT